MTLTKFLRHFTVIKSALNIFTACLVLLYCYYKKLFELKNRSETWSGDFIYSVVFVLCTGVNYLWYKVTLFFLAKQKY